jgi:hypothetical protein
MATKYTKWPQNIPNGHRIYQMATKYTKWPQNIPNGHKIYQMATKYTNWPQNNFFSATEPQTTIRSLKHWLSKSDGIVW